jgi:hypothetical protein
VSFLINPYSFGALGLFQSIQAAGVATTNLQLCEDVADYASYTGTGQTWTDTSASATSFYRGAGSGGGGDDPTFNGTAGALDANTYWSFDGGDYFTPVSGANPAWIEPFHKTNATFTIVAALYHPSGGVGGAVIGDRAAVSPTGFAFSVTSANKVNIAIYSAGSTVLNDTSFALSLNVDAWNIIGVSLDGAGGVTDGFEFINGATETFDPSFVGSVSNANAVACIASYGNGASPLQSGSRLAWIAVFNTDLSAAQMQAIYTQTRGRFGI